MGRYRQRSREQQKHGHLWSQVLVDPCDLWLLTAYAWSIYWDSKSKFYVIGGDLIKGRMVTRYLHRVIMNAPPGVEVDHINGKTLDNRRCNLRLCTNTQQAQNRKSRGETSKFKGVYRDKQNKMWRARIMVGQRRIHLGRFDDEEGAAFAYDVAARQLFGEFARFNFPCPGEQSCLA